MADELKVIASQPPPASGELSVVASQPPPGTTGIEGFETRHPVAATALGIPLAQEGSQLLQGVGESVVLDPLQGLKNGANKLLGTHIPDVPGRTNDPNAPPDNTITWVGRQLGDAGTFAAGEGLVTKAGKMLEIAQRFPKLIALMELNPKAAGVLTKLVESDVAEAAAKNAIVGGAQGGVKASSEGKGAGKAAEFGALGGGILGGAAEGLFGGARAVGNKMLGETPEEAFTLAGRPYARDVNWKRAAERGIPIIEQEAKKTPFKNFGEFVDLLDRTRQSIWDNKIQPIINNNASAIVDGGPVADLIRDGADKSWGLAPNVFKNEIKEHANVLQDFEGKQWTVEEANSLLRGINKKLNNYYSLTAEKKAAERIGDGEINALERAADGLREQIYDRLAQTMSPADATDFFEARQNYGAMKDLHRVMARREVVFSRQAPVNLSQALGHLEAVTALLTGHPLAALAGAVPGISRWMNSPEFLVRRGLSLQRGPSTLKEVAKEAAPAAAGYLGSRAGRAAAPNEDQEFTPEPVAEQ